MKNTVLSFTLFCWALITCINGAAYAVEQNSTSGMVETTRSEAAADNAPGEVSETISSETSTSGEQSTMQESGSEPTEQTTPAVDEQTGNGTIARAQFTTAMQDREPTDDIATLGNTHDRIYFFTDLVDFEGATITHRWEYQGKTMAEVNFNVGGSRWRVYSSKSLKPEWTGTWSVTVLDGQGTPLKVHNFDLVTEDSTQ